MKTNIFKLMNLLIFTVFLLNLVGCANQNPALDIVSNNATESTVSVSSQYTPSSSISETTTSTKSTATSKENNTSINNSTSSNKTQTNNTSTSKNTVTEKPAVTYEALEKNFINYFTQNSKFKKDSISSFLYDLPDGDFYIIPKDILKFNTNSFLETTEIYGKEALFGALISQYNDYTNYSDVPHALSRDLKILEEFVGHKPYKFVYGDASKGEYCENFNDLPDSFLRYFYKGTKDTQSLAVYFGEDKNLDNKLQAVFSCKYTSTNLNTEPVKYHYSVHIYLEYNRDEYLDSLGAVN